MKKFLIHDRKILWAGVLVILVLLMMDFNNRMGELLRLSDQREVISTQVTAQVKTQESLQTQIAYATSDVAVQEWAREENHMIQAGDVPIVPLTPEGSTPQPVASPQPTPEPVMNWEVWEELFLGKR